MRSIIEEVLYPYQKEAAHAIVTKRRLLIADQPGLGKTLEVLGGLEEAGVFRSGDSHAVLVLTPLVNVKSAWIRSIKIFLLPRHPDLVVLDLGTGSSTKKEALLADALASPTTAPIIVVANHDSITAIKGIPRVPSLVKTFWSAVVIDESHLVLPIVTPGKLTNFWRGLMKLEYHDPENPIRIAVSGTPDRGKIHYRYGTWRFLNPMIANQNQWSWLESNFNVYDRQVTRNRKVKQIGALKSPTSWITLDRQHVVRRTKEEVLPELPPKTYHFMELPMTRPQYYAYKEAETQAILDSSTTPNALLTFAIHARQLSVHAEDESGKLEWLTQWLSERGYIEDLGITGKVVIASQFVKTLKWLQGKLAELGIAAGTLTGDMTATARNYVQERFQDPEDPLRVILLSGGMGVGIDLDIADDLIMLDLPYDPDKLEQIEDRIHRASNMHKVTIWHLLSIGTIDMAIAEKSTTRRFVTRSLMDGARGIDFSRKVVDYVARTETIDGNH